MATEQPIQFQDGWDYIMNELIVPLKVLPMPLAPFQYILYNLNAFQSFLRIYMTNLIL